MQSRKLFQIIRLYLDEIMVVFLYTSWFALKQLECYANYGHFVFNIFTTGEPLVVALGFYSLKWLATEFRSMKDVELANKEKQEDEHA